MVDSEARLRTEDRRCVTAIGAHLMLSGFRGVGKKEKVDGDRGSRGGAGPIHVASFFENWHPSEEARKYQTILELDSPH